MDKLVSVIIPAYNVEKYIEQCVRSVIEQTYECLEIIVINDGSRDNTLKVLEKFDDSRLVIINQTNRGMSAARNAGLKECNGEYIFFLDSDDWLESSCIKKLMSIGLENKVDIVFCDYYKNYSDKEVEHHVYNRSFIYNNSQKDSILLRDMRTITSWGKLYSKKLIDDIIYDEKMKIAEDVDFNFRVYKNVKSAYFSNECLLHYRILEQSAVHGYDPNVRDKFKYPIEKMASYMKTESKEERKAYYSFAAIAYILICQNGVIRNDAISYRKKINSIKEISCEDWTKDLFSNSKYIKIPISRKALIYSSKIGFYFLMILAVNARKRLKR